MLKRISLVLAAVTAVVGVSPASASAFPIDAVHELTARGSVYLVNDEPLWQDDDTGTHAIEYKTLTQPSDQAMDWSDCQGGEVQAWTQVGAEYLGGGKLRVRVGLLMREGRRCRRDFFDSGELREQYFTLAPNEGREVKLTARNDDVASHDRADLTIVVYNRCTLLFMDRCRG
jgi:hypothetical protein